MDIILYTNNSPDNYVNKQLALVGAINGSLVNESNIVRPTIRIENSNLPTFNYCYIAAFHRYYYLTEIRAVRTNIWDIMLKSDVLMSFDISNVSGVLVETSEQLSYVNYLPSRHFINRVKDKTDIIQFPQGLLENGEYILLTAGGL